QFHGALEVGASGGHKISMRIIKRDELTMTVSSAPWRSEKRAVPSELHLPSCSVTMQRGGTILVTSPSTGHAVDRRKKRPKVHLTQMSNGGSHLREFVTKQLRWAAEPSPRGILLCTREYSIPDGPTLKHS
ncbi:hypothetical protein PAXRUDRAFT_133714, partial [Paxillus rubicundulus Ve08.2h10]